MKPWRFIYALLGIGIGIISYLMYSKAVEAGFLTYIFLTLFAIVISLDIEETKLDTTSKKIAGLVIGIILCIPIAWIYHYLFALVVFIFQCIFGVLQFFGRVIF